MELSEEGRKLTKFITEEGVYTRLIYGLSNTSEEF